MRYNMKELMAVASQPAIKFDKEGVLFFKDKQDGILFRKSDVYTERWFRLKGNLLFYLRNRDPCSEPQGLIVLEHCHVEMGPRNQTMFCFSLVYNMEDHIYLGASSEAERDSWMHAFTSASIENLRRTAEELRAGLALAQEGPLTKSSSPQPSDSSHYGSEECADELRPLLLELSCDNLRCDHSGRPPNSMLVLMGSLAPAIWDTCGHTEVVERSSNPTYLLNVELTGRFCTTSSSIRVCCYDVKERVTKTKSFIGCASLSLRSLTMPSDNQPRLPLISPDHETVGFVTIAARTDFSSSTFKERISRSGLFENLFCTMYRFHTGLGAHLIVSEIMAESRLSFTIPQLLLNLWMTEEKRLLEIVLSMESATEGEWRSLQSIAVRRHMHLIETYHKASDTLADYCGSAFKTSIMKGDRPFEFVPVNLHLQRMAVRQHKNKDVCDYDVVTVGAFTAYPHKYAHGGLHRQLKQLKGMHSTAQAQNAAMDASWEAQSILGPDRLSQMAQSILTIEELREDIESSLESLLYNAQLRNVHVMMTLVEKINVKAKKLSVSCEKSLIEEALAIWDTARCTGSTAELRKALPLNLMDAGPPSLNRNKSASLPRQLCSSSGGFTLKDISDDEDDEQDNKQDERDFNSGSTTLQNARSTPTPRSHTPVQDLCEDFEPLDITSLNIRASTMCMTTKVYNLNQQEEYWAEELRPSVRKLRSAMQTLDRIARVTYGLLSLKEPSHTASLSYSVRYRRDVCFAQSLTATVVALQAKFWCQSPDQVLLRSLGSTGSALATFASYLSCYGDERGMMEDMLVAVKDLRNVTFIIEAFSSKVGPGPRIEGSRVNLRVVLPVPDSVIESAAFLNTSLDNTKFRLQFGLTPIYFNVGINEQATIAEKLGNIDLQERINTGGAELLVGYMRRFQRCQVKENIELQKLAELLDNQLSTRRNKNVDVLHTAMRMCRLMHGLRMTSCKSAKDRTGMSVTLEQVSILELDHNLAAHQVSHALQCMRSEGSRLQNCFKNIGSPKYAINTLQLMHMPKMYRPPVGTFGYGDT
ncbi:type I inositol 3,4-bisphosphate 4-phosphatase-like isoform X1 [Varroa jacobsoni]|uniref:type I inositol 3,4-bisphosphate 4-phosphatase-like isoform X1 n=2 Tax=Varroa jacobsoni TaxID=62625 RepID=UPI000BF44379|nr:type I inositol 3,4-bisphosphate 4-phosphatase-like isoform X1 [Varroa jacobsoni]